MEQQPFYAGLCLAGAVSAGSYTAGVIDHLLEALEEWDRRRGEPGVPGHRVVIPVIGGASAGGMTGIIAGAALQQKNVHLQQPDPDAIKNQHPENILYHTWVDLTGPDMFPLMLENSDISSGKVLSVLNSGFIKQIADRVLLPKPQAGKMEVEWKDLPPFVSRPLRVFATLSNLEGFVYDVNFKLQQQLRPYFMQIHNDYGCFWLSDDGKATDPEAVQKAKTLLEKAAQDAANAARQPGPDGKPNPTAVKAAAAAAARAADPSAIAAATGWIPLSVRKAVNVAPAIDTAMATGAFPVGLQARGVTRDAIYVNNSPLQTDSGGLLPVINNPYTSLNVDGGLINNEPFEKVRAVLDQLTGADPSAINDYNQFQSTVLMVAPFPSTKPDAINQDDSIGNVVGLTLSAMISQMRAKPVQLINAMAEDCAGQFLISPSRDFRDGNGKKIDIPGIPGERAIACGALHGFSGFMSKEFRVHDYFLGRFNCQIFLRDYFTVPEEALTRNPIFKAGYENANKDLFRSRAGGGEGNYYQIIPVSFEGTKEPTFPAYQFQSGKDWPVQDWGTISRFEDGIKSRSEAILLNLVNLSWGNRLLLKIGSWIVLRRVLSNAVLNAVKNALTEWRLLK